MPLITTWVAESKSDSIFQIFGGLQIKHGRYMDFSSAHSTASVLDLVNQMNNDDGNNINQNNESKTSQQSSSEFDRLDLEQTGYLDLAEFKGGLNSIGINLNHDEAFTLFESITGGMP